MRTDEQIESSLNLEIEQALVDGNVSNATRACIRFLETVYGKKAVGLWALREFAANRITEDAMSRSRFDNNLVKTLEARKEKVFRCPKLVYASPYFKDDKLEAIDSSYEEFKNRAPGKPTVSKFIKFINQALEEL